LADLGGCDEDGTTVQLSIGDKIFVEDTISQSIHTIYDFEHHKIIISGFYEGESVFTLEEMEEELKTYYKYNEDQDKKQEIVNPRNRLWVQ